MSIRLRTFDSVLSSAILVGNRTMRCAYHRESFSSILEARQQLGDPFGAGSTRECGFREGGRWCRATLVSSWKTGRSYPRVIGGDVGGSNDFVCRDEQPATRDVVVVTRTKPVDGYRRHWGCTVPSINGERSSRLLAFSTGAPLTSRPSQLDHSYPHSPPSFIPAEP